jgi:aspartyl-tRNA(Asn)/glutamyl-tRNA(Gln) amidotransferase subunit C
MKVDVETINKLAHLSRLELSPTETEAMTQNLSAVLDWMDKLNEVDTTGVEPLIHISEELNVLRADETEAPLSHERALRNAPRHDSDYFRVPKVIE